MYIDESIVRDINVSPKLFKVAFFRRGLGEEKHSFVSVANAAPAFVVNPHYSTLRGGFIPGFPRQSGLDLSINGQLWVFDMFLKSLIANFRF